MTPSFHPLSKHSPAELAELPSRSLSQEYPVTSLAAKLALKAEAKDDDGRAAATLEDQISGSTSTVGS